MVRVVPGGGSGPEQGQNGSGGHFEPPFWTRTWAQDNEQDDHQPGPLKRQQTTFLLENAVVLCTQYRLLRCEFWIKCPSTNFFDHIVTRHERYDMNYDKPSHDNQIVGNLANVGNNDKHRDY